MGAGGVSGRINFILAVSQPGLPSGGGLIFPVLLVLVMVFDAKLLPELLPGRRSGPADGALPYKRLTATSFPGRIDRSTKCCDAWWNSIVGSSQRSGLLNWVPSRRGHPNGRHILTMCNLSTSIL